MSSTIAINDWIRNELQQQSPNNQDILGITPSNTPVKLSLNDVWRFPSGINFNASGGDTLSAYEDSDTFTVTDQSGAGLSFTQFNTVVVRIGRMVFVSCVIIYPSTASGANVSLGGFPFVFNNGANFLSVVRQSGDEYRVSTVQSAGDNRIRIRDLQDNQLNNDDLSGSVVEINYYQIL